MNASLKFDTFRKNQASFHVNDMNLQQDLPFCSDGSGSKIFDPGQVKFLLLGSASLFGYGFGKFPLKMSNFSIFSPSDQKTVIGSGQKVPESEPGWPLIYCGSKVCLGRVGSGPISTFLNTTI